SLVQERMKTLIEIEQLIGFFYAQPQYPGELLVAKKSTPANTRHALIIAREVLAKLPTFTADDVELALRRAAEKAKRSAGELLWAVRVALSGQAASPGTFELLEFFAKEESLKRIDYALENLPTSPSSAGKTLVE